MRDYMNLGIVAFGLSLSLQNGNITNWRLVFFPQVDESELRGVLLSRQINVRGNITEVGGRYYGLLIAISVFYNSGLFEHVEMSE